MFDSASSTEPARLGTTHEESMTELTESNPTSDNIVIDSKRRQSIIPLSHQPTQFDAKNVSDCEPNNDDNEIEDEFDSFILNNFNPFSGSEDVIDWLDNTDKKFNLHKILTYLSLYGYTFTR